MHSTEYVRGTLNPTNPTAAGPRSLVTIEYALADAGIKSLLSGKGTHVRGVVEFQNTHKSSGPGFVQDFGYRLQQFLEEPEISSLGLEGEILVVSDYLKESPEIYTVYVRNGKATYKESHILWEPEEKRL